jgi:hypothetical protein
MENENINDLNNRMIKIAELCSNKPPLYAYGDNEAGCYMSNILDEINNIAYPIVT